MTAVAYIVIAGTTMILSGILGAVTAGFKNRDANHWGALCFLLPPALLFLLLLPKQAGPPRRRPPVDAEDHSDW